MYIVKPARLFTYFIQHCFICRHWDSTAESEDSGIEVQWTHDRFVFRRQAFELQEENRKLEEEEDQTRRKQDRKQEVKVRKPGGNKTGNRKWRWENQEETRPETGSKGEKTRRKQDRKQEEKVRKPRGNKTGNRK
jgi:hypothetical protein